jgi:hypothetical protein
MKTKIIPFDLETAKKIQAREIEGKVYFNTKQAYGSETYTFNLKSIHSINNSECPYYGLFECNGEDCIQYIKPNGYIPEQLVYLIIEVPDNEPQFKPFDKVLVRGTNNSLWVPRLFDRYQQSTKIYWCQDGYYYEFCVPYEGNQHLVGTTDKPDED